MLKKAAEKAEEKAADKIQAVLRSGVSATKLLPTVATHTPRVKPKGKTVGVPHTPRLSGDSKQKLKKMMSGVVPKTKLSGDSRKKLNQILNLGRAAKLKVNQYLAEN